MKLKRLKDQLKEPLYCSDYLSLPFTQSVILFYFILLYFITKRNMMCNNAINNTNIYFYLFIYFENVIGDN